MGRQSGSPEIKRKHYFVDEAGDPDASQTLVCHAFFAVCKTMETDSPQGGIT